MLVTRSQYIAKIAWRSLVWVLIVAGGIALAVGIVLMCGRLAWWR